MNQGFETNFTQLYDNWTFYNSSLETVLPRNNITYVGFYLHPPSTASIFIVSYLLIFLVCMVAGRNSNERYCMCTNCCSTLPCFSPLNKLCYFTHIFHCCCRFRCIVYPFKQKLTISTATMIIVIIWVLAISIMCPSGVMLQVTKEHTIRVLLGYDNKTSPFYWCRENWPNQEMRKIYTTVLFANIYLAPLSLIVIMYARIGITLFKTTVPTGGKPGHDNRHTVSKKKQRVIKMLLIVALLFILSWLPLWTLMMLSDYASLTEQQYRIINIYIYPFAHWLAFFNSSVNPIIYGFFNENFRRGFQSVFKFSLCTANGQRRKTYSHRLQGNSVLPANHVQTSMEPISLNSLDKTNCRRLNHVTEQDLVMEDLEKGSCSSGGVTAVSI
ncbi:neuropeptide FF receptor 2a [Boleophthalmus pectinirostris]|uniref:neuropeptide FF receptor 2a n=1 Tax=Boleophthalmus pectinirostris TaxID=150288 RepID=UPI00242BB1D5|nr:neuropeptide FF receptor 2a [Boleophthalmus pectinirostris]